LSDNGSGFIEGEALNVRCSHIEPKDQVVLRHRDVLICQVLGSFFFGPEVTDAECYEALRPFRITLVPR
jgi:hypothetical protein